MNGKLKKTGRIPGLFCAMSLCFLFLFPALVSAGPDGRFFLMGDGEIQIRNVHTGEEARVALLTPEGSLSEEAFKRIDEVFGFPARERGDHISPRLIFMLDYFSDLFAPGKVINIESGYRSPEYNSRLRNAGGNVAKASTHMDGMALDFNIEGVKGRELWEVIRGMNCCGAGHYGGNNVHLDSARPRSWEAATSGVRTGESDFNRRIYLSTDFDRYSPGEAMRLSFSSVTDFGFGIGGAVVLVRDSEGDIAVASARIGSLGKEDCVMIYNRESSRLITVVLPPDLPEGRYRVKVDFCMRPFKEMPGRTVSNEIEISRSRASR